MSAASVSDQKRWRIKWILGPWADLVFVILPPVLILACFLAWQSQSGLDALIYPVALLATGHHLPGMIRAYGDRDLFQRFRVRFVVAPLFLTSVCVYGTLNQLHGVFLIALVWGFWHAAMQIYGFVRIYDASIRQTDRISARLDLLMCWSWFLLAILNSPGRLNDVFTVWAQTGLTLPTAELVFSTRLLTTVVALATAVAFLANFMRVGFVNIGKVLVLFSGIGFWWYAMVGISDIILGVAMFEVFHDVQYLAIVWAFNRKRAEKGAALGTVTRMLFGRGVFLVIAYVGLVMAYGMLDTIPSTFASPIGQRLFSGLVLSSLLLHFYYDGFIWKVREAATQEGLGVSHSDRQPESVSALRSVRGYAHAAKWLLLIIPLGLFLATHKAGRALSPKQLYSITELVPRSWLAHYHYAIQETGHSRTRHLEKSLELRDDYDQSHFELGKHYLGSGAPHSAIPHFRRVIELSPDNIDARCNLGAALTACNRLREAQSTLEVAHRMAPEHAKVCLNLGAVLDRSRQHKEATEFLRRAVSLGLNDAQVHNNLGLAHMHQNEFDEAAVCFSTALEIAPEFTDAMLNLAVSYFRGGKKADAIALANNGLASSKDRSEDEAARFLALLSAFTDPETGQLDSLHVQ